MSPPSPTIAERVATVEADVRHLRDDVSEIKATVQAMAQSQAGMHASNDERLKAIETTLAEARGGWKTLMAAGTIGAGVASVGAGIIAKLKGWI
jgi:hypothetical protein